MEREIRELKKDEAESTDASLELVLLDFLRKDPRFGSDGSVDWTKCSLLCYDPDTDKDKLMTEN